MSATPAEYAARELKIAAMATLGHELPRRGKNGASALPPKAAAIATERRGRFGQFLPRRSLAGAAAIQPITDTKVACRRGC